LLVERSPADDGATLVDFYFLNRLSVAKNPPRELDIVDIANADARSVKSKSLNLAGLGAPSSMSSMSTSAMNLASLSSCRPDAPPGPRASEEGNKPIGLGGCSV
jgi:hypothetical protein